MEKVLYEYSFNLKNMLLCLIPLAVGIVFLAKSIAQVRSKEKSKGWDGFFESFFKFLGFIVGPVGIGLFLFSVASLVIEHTDYEKMLKNDDKFQELLELAMKLDMKKIIEYGKIIVCVRHSLNF